MGASKDAISRDDDRYTEAEAVRPTELEAAESRYRAIFNQAAVGMARVAPDGRFVEVNDRLCLITGYDRDEMLGKSFAEITHADDVADDLRQAEALLSRRIDHYAMEKRYHRKDGSLVWVNLTVSLVRDAAGEPEHFVAVVEDISRRKAAEDTMALNRELRRRIAEREIAIAELEREREERERAEAALLQIQKMDSLGQLTGGIAHDFNNLLQAIRGSFELIRRRGADEAKREQLVAAGLSVTERGAQLTGRLLAFSRSSQLSLETFIVADMVEGMRELFARTIGNGMALEFELDSDAIPVRTDRTQAELALLNLVINARDACGGKGRVVIRTELYEASSADADLVPGTYVRLSVCDDGPGMTAEIAAKAFEPFFTTKPVGHGTGLGLSQVYGVARQTGGTARLVSAPGEGTIVSLFIPRGEPADAGDTKAHAEGDAGTLPAATILLVDDHEAVRRAAATVLADLGMTVNEAGCGREALEIESRPDLALLDYAMPGMNGAELARALRERWPDLPVVFVTGHADIDELDTVLGSSETVLRKPYKLQDLEAVLARVLTGD